MGEKEAAKGFGDAEGGGEVAVRGNGEGDEGVTGRQRGGGVFRPWEA